MNSIGILVNGRLKSTRCPKKLIRPFAGTTLFELALQKLSVLGANLPVYVGVAEQELLELGSDYPAVQVLQRSMEAVQPGYADHRQVFAHYKHVDAEYIMWLNPCHPLLSID